MRLALPRWYLALIDQEAAHLGKERRSAFLEMLVRRAAGQQFIQRAPHLPQVVAPKLKDMSQEETWLWHCATDTKKLLEDLLVRGGNINPKAWTILHLNLWCGFPPTGPLSPPLPGVV